MRGLVIVPARGGSKGIPSKNVRFLAGKPLIYYVLESIKQSKHMLDIYVSTDSLKIKYIVELFGVKVLNRAVGLSEDDSTLDEVIIDAYNNQLKGKIYDYVVTIQPTSPFLKTQTIDKAIDTFRESSYDCLISVVNNPHLSWSEQNGKLIPNFISRANRQYLPKHHIETGGFVISRPSNFGHGSRISGKIGTIEIPHDESLDIDNYDDWIIAETRLKSKKIFIWVKGNITIGMGHIYRAMLLQEKLFFHKISIVTSKDSNLAIQKFTEENIPFFIVENENNLFELLKRDTPDILINDVLDTSIKFIKQCKDLVDKVVNFEDLGKGGNYADAVINDLYEFPIDYNLSNYYWGSKYFLIRDEFRLLRSNSFNEKVKNILIIFGGTDPSNLNEKLAAVAIRLHDKFNFTFVIGKGYEHYEKLLTQFSEFSSIQVSRDSNLVAKYMKESDLAISSQGRTMLELAYMRIPTIIMAQNERELKHSFGYLDNGFINLGLGRNLNSNEIIETILWLSNSSKIREELTEAQKKFNPENSLSNIEYVLFGGNYDNN